MALQAPRLRSRHPDGRHVTGRTLVTVAIAAEATGIGERTIRKWITARLLSAAPAAGGVKKRGSSVVVLQDVIALDQKLRRQRRSQPRARLRREHVAALVDLASRVPVDN